MRNKKVYILLIPILLLYTTFIVGGVLNTIVESMGFIPALGLEQVTLAYYVDIIVQKEFLRSLIYSLYIAVTSASISMIIGVLLAYKMLISEATLVKKITRNILQIGVVLPYLYAVFLVMIMLGRTGFVSRVLLNIGWIQELNQFPEIVYGPYGIGLIIVYILKGTPFIALYVMNFMGSISDNYHQVAKTLGANELQILKKIYLPLASNAIVWGSSVIFIYNLGAFEASYLLATNRFETLSSKLYTLYNSSNISMIPSAMAMNIILLGIGLVSVTIYAAILKSILKGGG